MAGAFVSKVRSAPFTGFSYYGYLFYDSQWQRWLNLDSLGEDEGINLYGFISNDPIAAMDAYGLADKWTPKDTFRPDVTGRGVNPDGTPKYPRIDRINSNGQKCKYNLDETPRKDAPNLNKKAWPKFREAAVRAGKIIGGIAFRLLTIPLIIMDPAMQFDPSINGGKQIA